METSRWHLALARLLAVAALLGMIATWVLGRDNPELESTAFFVVYGLGLWATAGLGLLLVTRKNHPLGWILLLVALDQILLILSFAYATYQQAPGQLGTLPGARYAAWASDQLWLATVVLVAIFIPLFFPDGRLPSPRWRHVFRLVIAGFLLTWMPILLEDRLFAFPDVAAPLSSIAPPAAVQTWLFAVGSLLGAVGLVAAIASPIVRWRRGNAVERQQLKWLFASLGLLIFVQVAVAVLDATGPVVDALSMIALVALPAALTAAIMRYRLFDIDRLFRRTVSYLLALGVLTGGYVVLVVGISRLVPAAGDSKLLVATVTLMAAFAARPVHQRIKGVLDRRFNRRGYDAEQVIERFRHLLADQIDADAVVKELVTTIASSLEPATISVYLNEGA